MSVPGYRFLFAADPFAWRVRYQEEVLALLRDADTLGGRGRVSAADRVGFLLGGLVQRLRHSDDLFQPCDTTEHRFDQSNGLIREREQTAFENENSRWWKQFAVPSMVPVMMVGGRPQERN